MNRDQREPNPRTPEEEAQLHEEERANFVSIAADRLEELKVSGPAMKDVLAAVDKRYVRWRNDQTKLIKELPDSEMQWGDRETGIRIGKLAGDMHRDVDKLVNDAAEKGSPLKDLVEGIKQRQQPSQHLHTDKER